MARTWQGFSSEDRNDGQLVDFGYCEVTTSFLPSSVRAASRPVGTSFITLALKGNPGCSSL